MSGITSTSRKPPGLAVASLALVWALLVPATRASDVGQGELVCQSPADEHAMWLGQRILAIAAALRSPEMPGAMDSVLALGMDSRYYVLVRGWLAKQLTGDLSIMDARNGDVSPQLAARIAFLQEAIRAIDLE